MGQSVVEMLPGTSDGMDDRRSGRSRGRRKFLEHCFHLDIEGDIRTVRGQQRTMYIQRTNTRRCTHRQTQTRGTYIYISTQVFAHAHVYTQRDNRCTQENYFALITSRVCNYFDKTHSFMPRHRATATYANRKVCLPVQMNKP